MFRVLVFFFDDELQIPTKWPSNSPTNGPPDVNSAVQWKSMYGLKSVDVGADPDASFATESTFSTPLNTIINPRTMEVIEIKEGYMDSYDTLEQLSYANGT